MATPSTGSSLHRQFPPAAAPSTVGALLPLIDDPYLLQVIWICHHSFGNNVSLGILPWLKTDVWPVVPIDASAEVPAKEKRLEGRLVILPTQGVTPLTSAGPDNPSSDSSFTKNLHLMIQVLGILVCNVMY